MQFFSKSKYLVDLFDNFKDIHNHLLPGIDDGAQNVDESIDLILQMKELGITSSICTPHTMSDFHPNTPSSIQIAENTLKKALLEKDIHFPIHGSSEYMLDTNFLHIAEKKEILPLKEDYILVEMSYLHPPMNLNEIIYKTFNADYQPILAHPERYAYLHTKYKKYQDLKHRGCLFQLNMLALGNYYGPHIKKMAYTLLRKDIYDFIGSDIHHIRHIEALKEIKLKEKDFNLAQAVIWKTTQFFL